MFTLFKMILNWIYPNALGSVENSEECEELYVEQMDVEQMDLNHSVV